MKQYYITKLLNNLNTKAFKLNLITKPIESENIGDISVILSNKNHYELVHQCNDINNLLHENNVPSVFLSKFAYYIQVDLMFKSETIKSAITNTNAEKVLNILLSKSKNSYVVGGAVRDILLKKTPKDFDFVTDIDIDTLICLFKENGYSVKETGKQFKVIIVSMNNEFFEIANFRKDGVYLDGRRPETVDIGTIEEDAQRRDFTVNALYYNFQNGLVDPNIQGIDDIKSKTLRYIGKAEERIKEDYLRIFRFYRFIQKGFTPTPKDIKATRRLFNEVYKYVEPERARLEIERMLDI